MEEATRDLPLADRAAIIDMLVQRGYLLGCAGKGHGHRIDEAFTRTNRFQDVMTTSMTSLAENHMVKPTDDPFIMVACEMARNIVGMHPEFFLDADPSEIVEAGRIANILVKLLRTYFKEDGREMLGLLTQD